jgi:hydrogenase maturation protease
MSEAPSGGTVVIGLGNPIMGDDGFGLAVLRRLQAAWQVAEDVDFIDGGTWGLMLLPIFESADRILLLDAIETGDVAGTLVRVERDDLPTTYSLRTSPHQVDLCDVLALTRLRGSLAADVVAIGAQPEIVDMTTELSPELQAMVDAAAEAAAAQLQSWGHACARRVVEPCTN